MKKDIRKIILVQLSKKEQIRVADIIETTGFSRAYINRFFQGLRRDGKIALIGKANQAFYVLSKNKDKAKKDILSVRTFLKNNNLSEDIVLKKVKTNNGIFLDLPSNIINIFDYAFTEMLNNAIEHSLSKNITVLVQRHENELRFEVLDFGIGIFKNIMQKKKLQNTMNAIQDLLKGKQTTNPKEHSGEGIFFTSKLADKMIIFGSNKKLIFDNAIGDVFIQDSARSIGTKIVFEISLDNKKTLQDVFNAYSGEKFSFDKTRVIVDLFALDALYVSRSQAKRVLVGLDKFKEVILDFKNVQTIGQGFADEIFRVWQKKHPEIKIECENTSDNVLFMIKRARSAIEDKNVQ